MHLQHRRKWAQVSRKKSDFYGQTQKEKQDDTQNSTPNHIVTVQAKTGEPFGLLAEQLFGVDPEKIEEASVPVGVLVITLYRDDLSEIGPQPTVRTTEIPFAIDRLHVVLVDDVFFTGRTVRAAMDALIDFGRPKRIELAVLIDRGHREFPVCANYVGLTVSTAQDEVVNVYMREAGEEERVAVENM